MMKSQQHETYFMISLRIRFFIFVYLAMAWKVADIIITKLQHWCIKMLVRLYLLICDMFNTK